MGIKIEKATTQPELVYDHIFMDRLTISQTRSESDSTIPIHDLLIEYRLFAVDENNKRHYQTKTNIITIKDYVTLAGLKAAQGDTDLLAAMGAIEVALAKIIQDQTELGTASVV
jgi:hypothetical protein